MKTPTTLLLLLLAMMFHFSCDRETVNPLHPADHVEVTALHPAQKTLLSEHVLVTYLAGNIQKILFHAGCPLPDCEKAIASAAEELEALADETGEVQYACIECCLDGYSIYAMLVAYPMMYPAESDIFDQYNGGSDDDVKPTFDYELKVTACSGNGFNVMVELPDDMADDFYYSWLLDGHFAGDTKGITCVCGSVVQVTVTRYSDHIPLTKYIELPYCAESDDIHTNSLGNRAY